MGVRAWGLMLLQIFMFLEPDQETIEDTASNGRTSATACVLALQTPCMLAHACMWSGRNMSDLARNTTIRHSGAVSAAPLREHMFCESRCRVGQGSFNPACAYTK
jgi:hypothetical protein